MEDLAELLGESPAIYVVREKVRRLLEGQRAGHRLPAILIQGETGTGKGLVARLVHRTGPRRDGPFVDINCPAIPEALLEGELFGYERGAFTDARRTKPGLFHTAHRGTLFLDEVGLLAASAQAKLLTVLEARAVRRLGSTRSEAVDVCVISATNMDLSAAVQAGRFRDDLYHRLAVIRLDLPPLRERGRDVLLLAERFLAQACADYGLTPLRLSEQAQARLLVYPWPGNVRELANVMERTALLAESAVITGAMLEPLAVVGPHPATPGPAASAGTVTPEEAMRQYLQGVLEDSSGNISQAASRLGVARNTLYARLEKYGVSGRDPSRYRLSRRATLPVPAPAGTATQWERRGLTFLCAAFVDGLESWSQTSRALDGVSDKLRTFDARVEELTPTGIVVSFGVDQGEDAPRRAAHAAMVIHKMAKRAHGDNSRTPRLKIGIHVAQVLVGRSETRTDIDADAKRAIRPALDQLLRALQPDETGVSAAAAPFLERRFEIVPIDDGQRGAGQVYRLTGQERRGMGLWGTMTPFVGRRDEIEVLRGALAAAWHGHGQFLSVVGEPGVGKSRLFWEFTHSAPVTDWLVLESGAVPYGKTTPYLPVIELLKRYFHIEERDETRTIREKVIGKALSLDRTLEPFLPGLLSLLDVPVEDEAWGRLDPAQRRRRTLEAVTRLLLRESQVQPLMLLFEDQQWIDAETQTLLDRLVESLPAARILVLANHRPEYRQPLTAGTCRRQVRLDALPAESAEDLLASLLGVDARLDELKRSLIERTGGNALFLEESVRTLVETGALIGVRGEYRVGQDATTVQVPATVESILAARIERLEPGEKRLLEAASVVGKDVPGRLLAAIGDLSEEELHRGLGHLQAAELLYERNSSPDLEYTFKHALTHDVTYGSLLPERRRELHARIVGAIESLYRDRLGEQIARLAHHARCGKVWEKALQYGWQMGDRGAARRAYREAIAGYEQALDALGRLPKTGETRALAVELRRALAHTLIIHGEHQRSLGLLEEAEALAQHLDDRGPLARLLSAMSYVRREMGDLDGAVEAGRRELAMAAALGDTVQQADAAYRLAQALNTMGDFGAAARLLRGNVEAVSLDGPGRSRAIDSRAWLGRATASLGEFAEGTRHAQEALRLAMEDGQGSSPITAHGCLGILYVLKGDWEPAIGVLESGLALCRAADDRNWSQAMAGALGAAYGHVGRLTEGLAVLEEVHSAAIQSRALPLQNLSAWQLSAVCLLAGRVDEAWSHARRALDLAQQLKSRGFKANALFQLAAVHAHVSAPDISQAEARYGEALAVAEPCGMRPLMAHCHLGLGTLYRRTDERDRAREHLTTATTMYCDMDMRFWLQQAEAGIADL